MSMSPEDELRTISNYQEISHPQIGALEEAHSGGWSAWNNSNNQSTQMPSTSLAALQLLSPRNLNVLASGPDKTEVTSLLECPVCYDLMLSPIFSCTKGHNVCFDCRRQIRSCPVCRETYDGHLRNLFAEELSSKCMMFCKYGGAGCKSTLYGNQLKGHHDFCSFRPVPCPDCEVDIPFNQFLQHINDHNVPTICCSEYSTGYEIQDHDFSTAPQKWELTWLWCFGHNFLCHTEKHENCWSFWVSCADNFETTPNYICEIILWNKDKGMQVTYKGPINSIRTSAKDVLENSTGLILTKTSVRANVYRGGVDVVFRILESEYEYPAAVHEAELNLSLSASISGGGSGDHNNATEQPSALTRDNPIVTQASGSWATRVPESASTEPEQPDPPVYATRFPILPIVTSNARGETSQPSTRGACAQDNNNSGSNIVPPNDEPLFSSDQHHSTFPNFRRVRGLQFTGSDGATYEAIPIVPLPALENQINAAFQTAALSNNNESEATQQTTSNRSNETAPASPRRPAQSQGHRAAARFSQLSSYRLSGAGRGHGRGRGRNTLTLRQQQELDGMAANSREP